MSEETLIIILFIATNILTATCFGLYDSRNFWRKKWEEDEDYITYHWGDKHE